MPSCKELRVCIELLKCNGLGHPISATSLQIVHVPLVCSRVDTEEIQTGARPEVRERDGKGSCKSRRVRGFFDLGR